MEDSSKMVLDQSFYRDWNRFRPSAIGYVLSLGSLETFAFRASKFTDKITAIASGTGCLLLNFLDALDEFSVSQKKKWADYLLGSLGADGMCDDNIDLAEPTQAQPFWALRAHRTRHIAWAIEVLGGELTVPLKMAREIYGQGNARKWLDELWKQEWPGEIWAGGNWIMDMCVMLDLNLRHFGDLQAKDALFELLDVLDELQDPQTGYWFHAQEDERCAMAGAMHLYPVYWAYGRPVNYQQQIIEHTLTLQQEDGLFDYTVNQGGSQCLDYDSVLVLAGAAVHCPEYKPQIKEACQKVLKAIVVNHNEDGSFSDSRKDFLCHWATSATAFRADGGSVWDTYARLMTIAMSIQQVTGQLPQPIKTENHLFEIFEGGTGWHDGVLLNMQK